VIVVDTSVIIAVIMGEPFAKRLMGRLLQEPVSERRMSVACYLEAGTVIAGRRPANPLAAVAELDAFIKDGRIDLVPVDEAQTRVALSARIRYGRGMGHGGTLNFGDCFSYALARTLEAPLLYVGNDFEQTDLVSAL
jgi:ribonuclease VapC